jgi:hypothetical protein
MSLLRRMVATIGLLLALALTGCATGTPPATSTAPVDRLTIFNSYKDRQP